MGRSVGGEKKKRGEKQKPSDRQTRPLSTPFPDNKHKHNIAPFSSATAAVRAKEGHTSCLKLFFRHPRRLIKKFCDSCQPLALNKRKREEEGKKKEKRQAAM